MKVRLSPPVVCASPHPYRLSKECTFSIKPFLGWSQALLVGLVCSGQEAQAPAPRRGLLLRHVVVVLDADGVL